jgi:uncharacterized coiled-coil DUF342 family protein
MHRITSRGKMNDSEKRNLSSQLSVLNTKILELTTQLEYNHTLMEEDGAFDHLIDENEEISRKIANLEIEVAELTKQLNEPPR